MIPLIDMALWPKTGMATLWPPLLRNPPGRPRLKRTRPNDEAKQPYKLQRYHTSLQCQICFQYGHNRRTCKRAPPSVPRTTSERTNRPLRPKGGRPPAPVSKEKQMYMEDVASSGRGSKGGKGGRGGKGSRVGKGAENVIANNDSVSGARGGRGIVGRGRGVGRDSNGRGGSNGGGRVNNSRSDSNGGGRGTNSGGGVLIVGRGRGRGGRAIIATGRGPFRAHFQNPAQASTSQSAPNTQ